MLLRLPNFVDAMQSVIFIILTLSRVLCEGRDRLDVPTHLKHYHKNYVPFDLECGCQLS